MKFLFIIALTLFCTATTFSQSGTDTLPQKENVKLQTRVRNGVVELRWYPANISAWRKANHLGYTIKRKELNDASDFSHMAVVKPFTADEWKQKANTSDKMVKGTMDLITSTPATKEVATILEEENENFVMFILATSLSADAAKGAGLVYNDNIIETGKQYIYSVSINSGKGKKNNDDEVLAFVTDTRSPYIAPAPQDVTAEEGESFVKLTWNNTTNKELFTAYNIERSSDGGKTFTKVNDLPFTSLAKQTDELYYTDSVKNYISYQYRIVGITPWVDNSNPSEVVMGMGRDKTPASPPLNTRATGDRSKITVSWELPVPSKDLKGFTVARSHKLEGPFNAINDNLVTTSTRSFVDTKPSPQEPFYAVYSVDTANNMSSTFSVMASIYDSVAPNQPTALTGRIDSNGVVKLNWKFGSDNDLLGYQVYVANKKTNVYRQITSSPLVDSALVDTVNMRSLTEEVYYKITAVDYNNNASEYSEILTIKRPDVIPPSAPVITSYAVENGKVMLTWQNSNSIDVMKHSVVRKSEDAREEKLLLEFRDSTTLTFTDTTATEGSSYTYEVRAHDDAGYVTPSSALAITFAETSIRPGVERFTAQWNNNDKKAKLQWHFNDKAEYELVLFKAGEDGELKAYKKLKADKRTFEEGLSTGKYQYAIKVIYANGAESTLSEPVNIEAI